MIQPQLCFIYFLCFLFVSLRSDPCYGMYQNTSHKHLKTFHVGVILDMTSVIGRVGWSCISMAHSDIYTSAHSNRKTRMVLHLRDSQGDTAKSAFAALDLLKNEEVEAIIGPQKSMEADFVINLGEKARVPIISFSATGSTLSSQTPYFVRAAQNDSSQVNAITAIIQAFKWKEIIAICEDSEYGNGLVPYLVDALQDIQTRVSFRSAISLSATDDQILKELYKLMTMRTKVFVVHMTYSLGSRFFLKAREVGMMTDGYVWIVTYGLMNLFDSMDTNVVASMQGVLGVMPYIKGSKELDNFQARWKKKFTEENPHSGKFELNTFGLWAYDAVWALSMAVERVGSSKSIYGVSRVRNNLSSLTTISTSQHGQALLHSILQTRFKGLSGDFHLINGQLQSYKFGIVNVIGDGKREVGLWTPEHGVSEELMSDFQGIVWPGESLVVPKGWMLPLNGKMLRVGVPVNTHFKEFVRVNYDPHSNVTTVTGQAIDIFKSVMAALPYAVSYEFIPFQKPDGTSAGNYNDLVYQVYLQRFDAVAGDVMITANRSMYVDFTLPYAGGGVFMVVPVTYIDKHNAWIFLKPLMKDLWLTTGAFFILTGFVIWVLEHRVNDAFRGPPSQHVGMIFWFPLSTLVFAHRERVVSNLTRFVVIVWIFVVLILSSSYNASLSSMLTVQRLKPTITGIEDLVRNGDYVGCLKGSFIRGLLKQHKLNESKLKFFNSSEEYHEALQKGSKNGGITAYIDSNRFIKLFMAKYCDKYMVIGPLYKTKGVGFVFPKRSPLVSDVSTAILKIKESGKMEEIDLVWFGNKTTCSERGNTDDSSNSLSFNSLRALFVTTGTVSGSALLVSLVIFLNKHRHVLITHDTLWQKVQTLVKKFDKKDPSSYWFQRKGTDITRSPEVRDFEAYPGNSLSSPRGTISSDVGSSNSFDLEEMVDVVLSD